MLTTVTITLPSTHAKRLSRMALRYGFSLPEFSRRILEGVTAEFPEDSFSEYENPRALRASFARALADLRAGRARASL